MPHYSIMSNNFIRVTADTLVVQKERKKVTEVHDIQPKAGNGIQCYSWASSETVDGKDISQLLKGAGKG